MKPIIGIDLGTTNSVVALVRDGYPEVLAKSNGERLIPSVVGYNSHNQQWLVGTPARNQQLVEPENTAASIKRKMGQPVTVSLGDKSFTPAQVSALILGEMKRIAETAAGFPIQDAVITVPAYFTDAQRQATKQAGELAGLTVARIINEPTAAALAYGLQDEQDKLILVYDLGGGTFDVSLVELMGGVVEVRATHGNTELGGDDFDLRLAEWVNDQFHTLHNVDLREDGKAWARLVRAAEQAKKELSTQPYVWLKEAFIAEKEGIPLHIEMEISRADFVDTILDLLQETLASVEQVLEDAEATADELDMILLVGGSTRMPIVTDLLEEEFGLQPQAAINPDEAVALGAAVQAAIIAGVPIDAILVDVTPHSLGIEVAETSFSGQLRGDVYKKLIPRNTTIPTTREERFYTIHPHQDTIEVKVFQGEQPIASANTLLGTFKLTGLKGPTPDELAEISIRFDFDLNGILKVAAKDRRTNKEVGIAVDVVVSHLSDVDLTAVQEILEAPEDDEAPLVLSPTLAAGMQQAHKLLGGGDLSPDIAANVQALLGRIEAALAEKDEESLADLEEELLDLLFDLEE